MHPCKWIYLYRTIDQNGDTIKFWLSRKRDTKAARKFFRKVLRLPHNSNPEVITTELVVAPRCIKSNHIKPLEYFRYFYISFATQSSSSCII